MQFLKNIFYTVYKKPSLYLFIFLVIFSIDRYNRWVDFNQGNAPFIQDVDQYYSYLPAALIHHDLSFNFPNNYWTTNLENGNHIPKVTMGMAIMYSPFFFAAHIIAKSNGYTEDGYSSPYKWSIHFGSILFTLLGLWFSRKNLLYFFNEWVTAITLICIFFGTNLFYYTYGTGEMPHAYLFFIFSVFIFFVLKWHHTQKIKYLLLFSFVAGFATLIRPTESVILLFPLLLGVKNLKDFKQRIKLFISYKKNILFAGVLFLIPFFTQMIYWKIYAGQWFFFSYGSGEGFFFSDPQIINFLFSFRKGWLIYTPIMFFAVVGIVFLRKQNSELFIFSLLYFVLNIYILSSWWDWAFGGSFGCRALIQHYAFFIFSFAAFVASFFNILKTKPILNYSLKLILGFVFFGLILFNFTQSWQFKYAIIPADGMTKEAYLFILNKEEMTREDLILLSQKVKKPNRDEMMMGKRD